MTIIPDSTTGGIDIDDDGQVIILEDVNIINTSGDAIHFNELTAFTIDILGYVNGNRAGLTGYYPFADGGTFYRVNVADSGRVFGLQYALDFITSAARSSFHVLNEGSIVSSNIAVYLRNFLEVEINNSGIISGITQAILFSRSTGIVNNTGDIFGDVVFSNGDDAFLGETGFVSGVVFGNDGDDVIKTGIGDDLISGGTGGDEIWGGAGVDTVIYIESNRGVRIHLDQHHAARGHANGDELYEIENVLGSNFNDYLRGDDGDNRLDGGVGDDLLKGGSGEDRLLGGADDDVLQGQLGNDVLNGGLGRDRLEGGGGEDIFEFTSLSDSGTTGQTRDVLFDFQPGYDHIDLSQIGATSYGGSKFSGTAGEVISFFTASGGRTVIELDADGDSQADFAIVIINGAFQLDSGDFLLG